VSNTTTNQDREVCTQGSDHIAVATDPDLCYVPGESAPRAFPNTVETSRLGRGKTWRTYIDSEAVWIDHAKLGPPSEPAHEGTDGGKRSGTYRDVAEATSWSPDVFFENGKLIRCSDSTTQNSGNSNGIVLIKIKKLLKAAGIDLPDACKYLLPNEHRIGTGASDAYKRIAMTKAPPAVPVKEPDGQTHRFRRTPYQDPEPADIYKANINGHIITIITPRGGGSDAERHSNGRELVSTHTPSVTQIMSSLALLPQSVVTTIDTVLVNPVRSTRDRRREDQRQRADADTGERRVTYFPRLESPSDAVVHANTIHEGGHAFAQDLFAKDSAQEARWAQAMTADGQKPSEYACASPGEDFAESFLMYTLSKGTQCEAYARYFYPNRYKMLDDLFPPHVSTP
jgi:Domain of unknown function (DUF4150)